MEALIAAHARGVAVRVLLDSVGSGYVFSAALRQLSRAGVPAARFLHTWVPWRMPFLNMRNHKKLLIVDGALGFTGGLNIGAENMRATRTRKRPAWTTSMPRIEGPVVAQLMDTFARDWYFTTDEELEDAIWWPQHRAGRARCSRAACARGPMPTSTSWKRCSAPALTHASKRVRIVTPYFLPDQRLQFALDQARLRGVASRDPASGTLRLSLPGLGHARASALRPAICMAASISARRLSTMPS